LLGGGLDGHARHRPPSHHGHGVNGLSADEFEQIKRDLPTLTSAQAEVRLQQAAAAAAAASIEEGAQQQHFPQSKIKHFVVLFMENRALDHTFGCMLGDKPGFDGIPSAGRSFPVDGADPSKGDFNVTCGTADFVCTNHTGPAFNLFGGFFAPGANSTTHPYGEQGAKWAGNNIGRIKYPGEDRSFPVRM